MTEFLIFAAVIGGMCYGLKQWLAYQERQQFMQRLDTRQRETGQIIDAGAAKQLYAALQPPRPAKPGGMNKYVVMALCAIYIVCPLDFIPDFLPVIGWGDDLAAAIIGLRAMLFK